MELNQNVANEIGSAPEKRNTNSNEIHRMRVYENRIATAQQRSKQRQMLFFSIFFALDKKDIQLVLERKKKHKRQS